MRRTVPLLPQHPGTWKLLQGILLVAPLPVLSYGLYVGFRLARIQPPQETGISEFMTSVWFLMGVAICHFAAVGYGIRGDMKAYYRWLVPAALMLLLGLDESFRIHENIEKALGVSSTVVFAAYAPLLLAALYLFRHSGRSFWVCIALFILFCGTSQTADTLYGEGIIYSYEGELYLDKFKIPGGRTRGQPNAELDWDLDFEQVFESFGAWFLAMAFTLEAGRALAWRPKQK